MQKFSIAVAAILVLTSAIHCAAQQEIKGPWRASSSAAANITGDIQFSDSKLTINFSSFPIALAQTLKPAEVSAVFDEDVNTAGSGTLYRLNVPAALKLLHRNTLCGTEQTRWMAAYVSGRTLKAAFFSGTDVPVFTFDAITNSSNLCGTYTYVR
ncbi:MAG: hypothetical protein WBE38_00015 [Terracidiphilus sp.]